jgi:hypothetical protein
MTERGHLVRLSAKRENVAGIHYQQVSAPRALAGEMPALRWVVSQFAGDGPRTVWSQYRER